MVAKYTLKLVNKYNDAAFNFYASPPSLDTWDSNIWCSVTITSNGSAQLETDMTIYAWCGLTIGTAVPGTAAVGITEPVVVGSMTVPGTTWKTAAADGSAIRFVEALPSASPGSFEIHTGTDFIAEDNFWVGAAWVDPNDVTNRVPVKTFPAKPGTRYQISTPPIFYVAPARTTLPEATTVPVRSWNFGATGMIGMNYGEITFKADGTFSPAVYKRTPS